MSKKLTLLMSFITSLCFAQKQPLNHQVYDAWQSIEQSQLSQNGLWSAFNVAVQQGDGNLYFKQLKTLNTHRIPRAQNPRFTPDAKFAVFIIKPQYTETRTAKIKKKKATDMPKDSLGILNLLSGSIDKTPKVKSFKLAEKSSSYVAYQLEKIDSAKKGTSSPKSDAADMSFYADEDDTKVEEGSELVLKNLTTGSLRSFKTVSGYEFNKEGTQLIFARTGSKSDKYADAGVYLLNLQKNTLKTLVRGKGSYKNFVFDEEGDALAFLGEQSPEKQEIKNYNIYYNAASLDTAQVLVDLDIPGIPTNWSISGDASLKFSKEGHRLYFGLASTKLPKDTSIVDFEVAKVDVWHYKDDYLQTVQLKNLARENRRSYLATIDIYNADPKVVPLTDVQVPDATLLNEGDAPYVLASTDFGKRIESQWTGSTLRDYYLVDVKNGSRKRIIENLSGNIYPSPAGKYILYFNNSTGNFHSYNISTGQSVQLNSGMNVKFADEENDVPDAARSYGIAGWSAEDKQVFIYDKYDIWAFAADGKSQPKNITNFYGRNQELTFRYLKLASEARAINTKEAYLSAFSHKTKEKGFYKANLNQSKNPTALIFGKNTYSRLTKAKDAESFIFERSSYTESPNLFATQDFKQLQQLSQSNPQQKDYNWGTAELVKWTTPKGYAAEGILYKPEDFDPNKKYPMIAYFYEKLSDGLYQYIPPAPTPSRLNISYFVSNGYLVFAPDIAYENGYPGKSAVEYINSGVEALKKNTWLDGSKIGIQGQSWGGYQVAYLITENDMYAAAWSGAPVVNMTSAYGGIRWESGMNRQFQYEKTQSRIGATLWEKPELYIENSPLFKFPKVNTPVVIMANDADGAVPWYQGIEMFTALRRLGKPAWMLNYNNEAHNLVQRQNRKDIQIREQQFFDHYLKGAPAPKWLSSGIPASAKGKDWGFELSTDKP